MKLPIKRCVIFFSTSRMPPLRRRSSALNLLTTSCGGRAGEYLGMYVILDNNIL